MMNFRPRLDEALLPSREPATNALDWIESERGQGVLIQGVEVRSMVRGTDLHEHPNDYSEKARQFGHTALYIVCPNFIACPDFVGPTPGITCRARLNDCSRSEHTSAPCLVHAVVVQPVF